MENFQMFQEQEMENHRKHILEEIDGKRMYKFMENFQYIREAGTEAEKRAASSIKEYLSNNIHIESHEETFLFDTFEIEKAQLFVTEPYRKEYQITGYGYCDSTAKEGIESEFLYAENGDPISLSHAEGKIVMINGPVRPRIFKNLQAAKVAGFFCITGTPIDEGIDRQPQQLRLRGMKEYSIPGAVIHYKDAVELIEKNAEKVQLTVLQTKIKKESRNIVARIEGTDKKEEILTLTAHYDSVAEGPGAYDNLAGAAIIMELCRYFHNHPPRRTLEFVWFGAEEKGLCGSLDYVTRHKKELSCYRFNMNVDLAGQLIGGTVFGITANKEVGDILTGYAKEIELGMSVLNKIWAGDSNSFAWKGVPAMTLNRDGFGMHTRYDTIELISDRSLRRSAMLLGYVAACLSNTEEFPFERKVPEEMIKQLDQMFQ